MNPFKRSVMVILLLVVIGAANIGLSQPLTPIQAQEGENTFTPCTGYSQESGTTVNAGPWANRLLIAFSEDGLTWEPANRILSDQADVPDVIVTSDGEIRVYYITWCPKTIRNQIAVASSTDGQSWTYQTITITREDGGQLGMPADPTIEITDEGKYRLYFTAQIPPDKHGGSYSAISEDGYNFVFEPGARFSLPNRNALDVNVLKIGATWHYFAGGEPGKNLHATSPDGLNFTRLEDFVQDSIIMSNGIAVEGGYRYYGFQQMPGSTHIVSFFTTDGETWTLEPGRRLEVDDSTQLEAEVVKDPAVAQLPDGRWIMIYVSMIPEFPLQKGK
ncbi:MAG: hypothetical protein IAE83_13240 [Anaerolinea sp.]|nr:hypothetical protein [Anaerolinea sp.]MCC6975329.1 hypothetical protein [Anaerolineae bacterium]